MHHNESHTHTEFHDSVHDTTVHDGTLRDNTLRDDMNTRPHETPDDLPHETPSLLFQIRGMRKADLVQVEEIERRSFSDPWSGDLFLPELSHPHATCLIAEADDIVLGYILVHRILDEVHINNLAVAPEYRRMGVGQKLIRTVFTEGVEALTLEVRAGNVGAIRFYERMGFVTEGIRKKYYTHPSEDARIMWKRRETCL